MMKKSSMCSLGEGVGIEDSGWGAASAKALGLHHARRLGSSKESSVAEAEQGRRVGRRRENTEGLRVPVHKVLEIFSA